MASFGSRLSAVMQEKGYKTADLSRATGISTSLITHWKTDVKI